MQTTLYRKYRPKNFSEVAGESDIVRTLKNSLDSNKISHAYLFCGPRGVGKTTSARLIAKGINCLKNGISSNPCDECENCLAINEGSFIDLIEIDGASNRGIDEIRDLKEKINYQPVKGRKKVYIIDEVHMLTKEAFNALLKTLEEPPSHVIFILATTEPDKILPTIISRCQRYDFSFLTYIEVKDKLLEICQKENIEIDEGSFSIIYENSSGSMRDAISILERIIVSFLGEKIDEEKCYKLIGATPKSILKNFLEIIKDKKIFEGIKFVDKIWKESIDVEKFFKDFAKYVKDLILYEEIEAEEGVKIIGDVFNSLNIFKYEEDKRLLGYVILNTLIKKDNSKTNIEKEIIYKEIPNVSQELKEEVEISQNIFIEDIKDKWNEILKSARAEKMTFSAFLIDAYPEKIEKNILYIGFDSNSFAKEEMETEYYNNVFETVISKIVGVKLKIRYFLKTSKNQEKRYDRNEGELISDLKAYFSEEN